MGTQSFHLKMLRFFHGWSWPLKFFLKFFYKFLLTFEMIFSVCCVASYLCLQSTSCDFAIYWLQVSPDIFYVSSIGITWYLGGLTLILQVCLPKITIASPSLSPWPWGSLLRWVAKTFVQAEVVPGNFKNLAHTSLGLLPWWLRQ